MTSGRSTAPSGWTSPAPCSTPSGGSIETWDFCLDHDYNYSYLSFNGYKGGKALLDGFWERRADRGDQNESPYRTSFAQIICVADTDAEAAKLYAEKVMPRLRNIWPG